MAAVVDDVVACDGVLRLLPFDVTQAAPIGDRTVRDCGHGVPREP